MVYQPRTCGSNTNLVPFIKNMTDLRDEKGKRHALYVVIITAIMAIMNAYTSFRGFETYAIRNKKQLYKIFKLSKKRLPKKDTFREVFKRIDINELNYLFQKEFNIDTNKKSWISIDGKTIRNTLPNQLNAFVSIVSFFIHDKKEVLLQGKIDSKNFETHLARKFLEILKDKGLIVTADALYTEKSLISQISEEGNYYVLPVKNNRRKLYSKVSFIAKYSSPISIDKTIEKNRGRTEIREVKVFENEFKHDLEAFGWKYVNKIIQVDREVFYPKSCKLTRSCVYYISNLDASASEFNLGIRRHWTIENSLHWLKDVVLNEDGVLVKEEKTATIFAVLRNLVLNILRRAGFESITEGIRMLMCDIRKMRKLLGGEN